MTGTIDFPDTPPKAYAMFAHCFTGSRFTPAAARVCKTLAEYGIASLRFDFPGLGQSEGEFAETSFSSNVEDIKSAYEWMSQHYSAPQLLVGHSLGGAAALKAGTKLPGLRAVATIGAPFDPAHAVLHFADRIKDVDDQGAVTVVLGGRDIVISRAFLEDLADTNPEAYLPMLRRPLMLVHSPIDQTVGVENAQNIFRKTRYPKSLVSLDKADHLCTRQGVAQKAGHVIGNWVQQYLVPEYTPAPTDTDTAIARPAAGTRFGDVVHTNGRELVTDRTKAAGGKNRGFSPTGLLMSALAAATSQAVREAARDMPLDDVEVSIINVLDSTFERKIHLKGDLNDEQRRVLLEAAKITDIEAMLQGANIMDVSG